MNDWHAIPEIIGTNAALRVAAMQAIDAVEQGRHFVVEGEPGSGRRLLARSAWCRRSPGARSLFTLDCRMLHSGGAEELLFGERSKCGSHTTIQLGKLNLATGGGLLLLHAEYLPPKVQSRLARSLEQYAGRSRHSGVQLLMTCARSVNSSLTLHPDLSAILLRVAVPALRERVEDIRPIAETFLRHISPFERIRCSQALIEKLSGYDWPGNISELRSVLRRLLLEPHTGLLDVRHFADSMCRDESSYALFHGAAKPSIGTGLVPQDSFSESRSLQ